ncbi:MAG TPA: acetyl-CoA C-acyltransferase, partial [Acidobacteriota bacterium]|nr:acetyl-CoA C-acyltransferase [Acidobacteriota bacterium]
MPRKHKDHGEKGMQEAFIVSGARTAVGKAPRGTLRNTRPDDMAAAVFKEVLKRAPDVRGDEIEDVIIGCAMPEAEQGLNVARMASLRAGLPAETSAITVNRFCASGLQAIAFAAERIASGSADCILAGGTESMSLIPMGGHRVVPNPTLIAENPEAYISMGLGTELLVKKFEISRSDQDQFSFQSHRKALEAIESGKFTDEIVPLQFEEVVLENGKRIRRNIQFETDEGPRKDTSLEALSALKPSFKKDGTVTPGNSSQMSDGSAAVLLMSRKKMEASGLQPLARFVSFATAGVPPELFGIGPVYAIPKALKLAGLSLSDIKIIELNEAFAGQSLAVIRKAGL